MNSKTAKLSIRLKESVKSALQEDFDFTEMSLSEHISWILESHLGGVDTSGEASNIYQFWKKKYDTIAIELLEARKALESSQKERDLLLSEYQNNLKSATNLAYQKGVEKGQKTHK